MDWRSEKRDGVLIVAFGGPINHENADELQKRLIPAVEAAGNAGKRLVIDFQDVEYMSSLGLRALTRAIRVAHKTSVEIVVANLNDTMCEIFRISRFDQLFPSFETLDAAVAG